MELRDAIEMLRPAVPARGGFWADLGAGDGTLTTALAHLIGPDGRILAVDRDTSALRRIEIPTIEVNEGDLTRIDQIGALDTQFDGIVLASVLHFFSDASALLASVSGRIKPSGTLIVIEYEGASRNRWVPYPVSITRLTALAAKAGFTAPEVVSERKSRYHGMLYCAVMQRS